MNQSDLEKQRDRLINWLEMLAVLPDESSEGKLRDAFWQGSLESELIAIEQRLDICRREVCANALISIRNFRNSLRTLGYG